MLGDFVFAGEGAKGGVAKRHDNPRIVKLLESLMEVVNPGGQFRAGDALDLVPGRLIRVDVVNPDLLTVEPDAREPSIE